MPYLACLHRAQFMLEAAYITSTTHGLECDPAPRSRLSHRWAVSYRWSLRGGRCSPLGRAAGRPCRGGRAPATTGTRASPDSRARYTRAGCGRGTCTAPNSPSRRGTGRRPTPQGGSTAATEHAQHTHKYGAGVDRLSLTVCLVSSALMPKVYNYFIWAMNVGKKRFWGLFVIFNIKATLELNVCPSIMECWH